MTDPCCSTLMHVASMSPLKLAAVFGSPTKGHESDSGVSLQPQGRNEIRVGAMNRCASLKKFARVVAFETGVVVADKKPFDITCCMIRTRRGISFGWSDLVPVPVKIYDKWVASNDLIAKVIPDPGEELMIGTIGTFIAEELKTDHADWYEASGHPIGRIEVMRKAFLRAFHKSGIQAVADAAKFNASLRKAKGVKEFLDIQDVMLSGKWGELCDEMKNLVSDLKPTMYGFIGERGMLLIGPFAHMKTGFFRAPDKLPYAGEDMDTIAYDIEGDSKRVMAAKKGIFKGEVVAIVDDVVATAGSVNAATELVEKQGGTVVVAIAPFAIQRDNGEMMHTLAQKVRFLMTQKEAAKGSLILHDDNVKNTARSSIEYDSDDDVKDPYCYDSLNAGLVERKHRMHRNFKGAVIVIVPPSLKNSLYREYQADIDWDRFAHSPNITFRVDQFKGKRVVMLVNPADSDEFLSCVCLAMILHKKGIALLDIVVQHFEHATQDRIWLTTKPDGDVYENLAMADPILRMLANIPDARIVVFDIHNTTLAISHGYVTNLSLIEGLAKKIIREYPDAVFVFPDAGAEKRFGYTVSGQKTVVYWKTRDPKNPDARSVKTYDKSDESAPHFVFDDIARGGSTAVEVGKDLRARGVHTVIAAFAHAAIEENTVKRLNAVFDEVYTTDSCGNDVPEAWVQYTVWHALIKAGIIQ